MPVIKDLIEAAAVKIAGFRRCRLGSHLKTPAFGGSAPRSRHFTMLREDQESRSLNDLWVVQGRRIRGRHVWLSVIRPRQKGGLPYMKMLTATAGLLLLALPAHAEPGTITRDTRGCLDADSTEGCRPVRRG